MTQDRELVKQGAIYDPEASQMWQEDIWEEP